VDEAIKTDALPGAPELTKSLKARHVAMISIGGIIGGGLFVNTMVYISDMGPAVILSYLLTGAIVLFVMRMLAEIAMARPGVGSCPGFSPLAATGPFKTFRGGARPPPPAGAWHR